MSSVILLRNIWNELTPRNIQIMPHISRINLNLFTVLHGITNWTKTLKVFMFLFEKA